MLVENRQMDQTIEPLSEDDTQRVEQQRTWVRDHYDEGVRENYETIEGKLRVIQAILDNRWVQPTETWKLQSLGIAFGDAVHQRLGMEWVMVADDIGRDPALRLPNSTIIVFPLTAISKRIERGEELNVAGLLDGFCNMVEEKRANGY